jgi:hypothetical protein
VSRRADNTGHPLLGGRLRRCIREREPDRRSAAQLARLAELQERNLITEREYHQARQRILGR